MSKDDCVPMEPHGWIILDKPRCLSSAQAVAAIKRILRGRIPRGWKIGHGGTLDPLATGVLPIALGEATKLAGRMLDGDKGYRFTLAFGAATQTDDAEGAVVETSDRRPSSAEVTAALPQFRGAIEQVPPIYSALKVGGERAYALARAGEAVELKLRHILVHRLELADAQGGDAALDRVTLDLICSKGTYVRAIARDLARALGTVGHVSMLRRTKAGPFTLDHAISLDIFERAVQERRLASVLAPFAAALDDIPALAVTREEAARLKLGQKLGGIPVKPGAYVAMLDMLPVALVEAVNGPETPPSGGATVRVTRGFNLSS